MVMLNSEIKERDFSHSPELAAVQKKAIREATYSTASMLDEYNQHPETLGGRYVCADTFKEIFPEFKNKEDRASVNNAIHNSAAVLSSTQFDEVLKREEPQKTEAIFITGIPGSGKTTTVTKSLMSERVKLMFEGQLANPESAFKKIENCLDKGLKVTIAAVHIDAEKSLDNTFKRFNEYGRGASIGIMAEIQGKLVNGLSQIRDRYGDQVSIIGFDQNNKSRLMTDWEDISKTLNAGTREQILEKLAIKTHHDFTEGKISQACYEQAQGAADIEALFESAFSQRNYDQKRIVAKSSGATLEQKNGDVWSGISTVAAHVSPGIYLLGAAKIAQKGEEYSGEIVHKDDVSVFQKTSKGLIRHSAYTLSKEVKLGQKCTIKHSSGEKPVINEVKTVKRVRQ